MWTEELSIVKEQVLLFNLWNPPQPTDPLVFEYLQVQIPHFDNKYEHYIADDHQYDQSDD